VKLFPVDQAGVVPVEPKEDPVPVLSEFGGQSRCKRIGCGKSRQEGRMAYLDVSIQALKLHKVDAATSVRVKDV
jgi:hypothetical protein